jgi:hypothetical protein
MFETLKMKALRSVQLSTIDLVMEAYRDGKSAKDA